jgi:hypothetical protein
LNVFLTDLIIVLFPLVLSIYYIQFIPIKLAMGVWLFKVYKRRISHPRGANGTKPKRPPGEINPEGVVAVLKNN